MFYVLQEDRRFLIDLWDEVLAGEHIYSFHELNMDLINQNCLYYLSDDEAGL